MTDRPFIVHVANGIQYLDAEYGRWWERVDLTRLHMDDRERHLLAQITGLRLYETYEYLFMSHQWRTDHGFVISVYKPLVPLLNAEWHFRIRLMKDERK